MFAQGEIHEEKYMKQFTTASLFLFYSLNANASTTCTFVSTSIIDMGLIDRVTAKGNLGVYRKLLLSIAETAKNSKLFHAQRRTQILADVQDLDRRIKSQMSTIPERVQDAAIRLLSPCDFSSELVKLKNAADRYDYAEIERLITPALNEIDELRSTL